MNMLKNSIQSVSLLAGTLLAMTLFSPTSWGSGGPVATPVAEPTFANALPEHKELVAALESCQKVVRTGNRQCVRAANGDEVAVGALVSDEARTERDTSQSMTGTGRDVRGRHQTVAGLNNRVYRGCQAAISNCRQSCGQALAFTEATLQKVHQIDSPSDPLKDAYFSLNDNKVELTLTLKKCEETFLPLANQAAVATGQAVIGAMGSDQVVRSIQAGGSPAGAEQPQEDKSFWQRNKTAIIAGGLAVGGYHLLTSGGKGGGGKGGGGKGGDGKGGDGEDEEDDKGGGFKQADCWAAGAYENPQCDGHFSILCYKDADGEDCQKFTNIYCGFGDGTDPGQGVVSSGEGNGVGSSYCRWMGAHRYCSAPGREDCPTCVNHILQQSPTCQNNPAACLQHNTQEWMAQGRDRCPTDPMFSDPHNHSIALRPQPDANGGQDESGSRGDGSRGGGAISGGSSEVPGGTPVGVSIQSTGATIENVQDVSPRQSPNLLNRHSAILQQRCRLGRLAGCDQLGSL